MAEKPTSLTMHQKLAALSAKYYSFLDWIPEKGHYYTTARDDLQLYQIVDITEDKVKTTYLHCESQISEWERDGFTTRDFGNRRVWVPEWILDHYKESV